MKSDMNDDIKKYPRYIFYNGLVQKADWVTSTESYNHYTYQLHHYIKKQSYERNPEWYKERGIEQKLILLPVQCHLDLHSCLSKFKEKWGIPREKLLYGAGG